MSKSQGLVADGIHSLSDLVADFVVLFASHHSKKETDEDHPYVHQRFETGASLALGVLLLAVGVGMLWSASRKLEAPETVQQVHVAALWVAGGALVVGFMVAKLGWSFGWDACRPMAQAGPRPRGAGDAGGSMNRDPPASGSSSMAGGLGEDEAARRPQRDGPNELLASRPRSVLRLAREVASESMFLLLVAWIAMGTIMLLGTVLAVPENGGLAHT